MYNREPLNKLTHTNQNRNQVKIGNYVTKELIGALKLDITESHEKILEAADTIEASFMPLKTKTKNYKSGKYFKMEE